MGRACNSTSAKGQTIIVLQACYIDTLHFGHVPYPQPGLSNYISVSPTEWAMKLSSSLCSTLVLVTLSDRLKSQRSEEFIDRSHQAGREILPNPHFRCAALSLSKRPLHQQHLLFVSQNITNRWHEKRTTFAALWKLIVAGTSCIFKLNFTSGDDCSYVISRHSIGYEMRKENKK